MKKSMLIIIMAVLSCSSFGQKKNPNDSLEGFELVHFQDQLNSIADKSEKKAFIDQIKRTYIKNKYRLIQLPVQEAKLQPKPFSLPYCPYNMDFESGNTSSWLVSGDYQITSGTGTDPYGGFPVVCPGGNFSLRLNDDNTSCSGINKKVNFNSTAQRTISILSSNSIVKINYAGVLLLFPHPQIAAANIRIELYDQMNNPITSHSVCYASPPNAVISSSFTSSSTSTIQGWQICNAGQYPTVYLPWQTKAFNLSSYIGQNVIIKLSADWCLYDYDWGYAYFDVCCDSTCSFATPSVISSTTTNMCLSSVKKTILCSSTNTNVNYTWYNSSGPIATGSCIVVSSSDSYTLYSASPSNTLNTTQEIFNVGTNTPVSFSVSSNAGCNNTSSGITLFTSPSGGTFSGPGISGNMFQPWMVPAGTYTITYNYTNPIGGCKDSASQIINVTTCTGVGSLNKEIVVSLYPNPFKQEFNLNCKNIPPSAELVLFNSIGQEVLRKRLDEGHNLIEATQLPAGLYIYIVSSQNKPVKQGKLVKE